jgi:copper(I)-binding protein
MSICTPRLTQAGAASSGDQTMTRTVFIVAAVLVAWAALPAQAEDVTVGGLKISAPWARATPKGASVGGGYLKITNTGTAPDVLVRGSTDISDSFELHEMKMEGNVMKMRPVANGIEIKPGQTVELNPSGYHVMFVELKKQLMPGDRFKATLEFDKAGKVDVDFIVESIGAKTGGDHDMPSMGGIQMK